MAEPAQPVPPKDQVPQTPADAERKLWLDFLAKLTDRELQKERASGATNWVLSAVAAATVYGIFQQLPRLLQPTVSWKVITCIIALELDFLLHFAFSTYLVYQYCRGPGERRLFSNLRRRADRVLNVAVVIIQLVFVGINGLASTTSTLPSFVRGTLGFFSLYWLVNLITFCRKCVSEFRKARKYRITMPKTTVEIFTTEFGAAAGAIFLIPFFIVPGAALVVYVSAITTASPEPAILQFNVATQAVLGAAIGGLLFSRLLVSASRSAYVDLERAIVVENLSPDAIKRRFTLELLGPPIAEWLKSIVQQAEENHKRLQDLLGSTKAGCAEIESIEPKYGIEREGRRKDLAKKLSDGQREFFEKYEALYAQLKEWFKMQGGDPSELETVKEYIKQISRTEELLKQCEEVLGSLSQVTAKKL